MKRYLTVLIILLLIVLGFGLVGAYVVQHPNFLNSIKSLLGIKVERSVETKSLEEVRAELIKQGDLFLTLTPKGGGSTGGYTYSFDSNEVNEISNDDNLDNYISVLYSFNKDSNTRAYVEAQAEDIVNKKVNPYSILLSNRSNKESIETVARLNESPRGPVAVSPDGKQVLYVERAPQKEGGIIADANELTIHYAKREQEGKWQSQKLWSGVSPKWLNDDLFFYLKNDGIYLGILSEGVEDKVWATTDTLGSNSNLAITNDGRYLAWVLPDAGKVYIFEISYNNKLSIFELNMVQTLNVHAFWAVFSPSGQHLALQTVDWDNLKLDPKPSIQIYSVDFGDNSIFGVDLNAFVQESMFLTDWR